MNNLKIIFILISCLIYFSSCKEKETGADVAKETVKETSERQVAYDDKGQIIQEIKDYTIENPDDLTILRNMQINLSPEQVTDLVKTANLELEKRWKASDKKAYIALYKDLYIYDRVHDGNKMSESGAYDDYWLDFNEDLTYKYGKNDKVIGQGRYHYDVDKQDLLMVDDDKALKPRNFEVKMVGETLIVVGKPEYKDNNFQSKLIKSTDRPS